MTLQPESSPVAEPPRIRVGHPEELVTAVPYILGFSPADSLVIITLREHGERTLIDTTVRLDLTPALDDPEDVIAQIAGRLTMGNDADALLFVYSDQELPTFWVRRLSVAAELHGLSPTGAWQVDDGRYRDLHSARAHWQPLTGEGGARVAAEFVLQGCAPAPSRDDLLPDLSPVSAPVVEAVQRICAVTGRPDVQVRHRAVRVWHRALTQGTPLGAARCGLVHAGLGSVLLRDALLASCLGMDEATVLRAATSRKAATGLFDRLLARGQATAPDPDRIAAASALLVELVRCAPPGRRAEPLSILAWCTWWSGDGASANQYLDLLLQEDKKHRLGQLLAAAIGGGVRPGWVPR